MKRAPLGDGWYESEEPTRSGMKIELQRIRRRTMVRPLPVLALALLVTAAVTYKVVTKPRRYTADVVLAIDEGSLGETSAAGKGIPFEELRQYVAEVLLPGDELLKLIDSRTPGRVDKVGRAFALEQFYDRVEITIWKNSFVYYHSVDANAQKSARVGIEVADEDPDTALEIGRAVAAIAIRTHEEQQAKVAKQLSADLLAARNRTIEELDRLGSEISAKQAAITKAQSANNRVLVARLAVDITELQYQEKRAAAKLEKIVSSPDAVADRATAAHLGTTITIVDAVTPPKHEQSWLVLSMIITVIGVGSLIGSALVVGAFDSRVHEADDVSRLGLPILGHVPGFSGDHIGSLWSRGATRARVPSFLRWLLQR